MAEVQMKEKDACAFVLASSTCILDGSSCCPLKTYHTILFLYFNLLKRSLPLFQVLGLNLVVMDLIFLLTMPLNLINLSPHFNQSGKRNRSLVVIASSRQYCCF